MKDLVGNYMTPDYSWSFTTGDELDIHPPTVNSTSPSNESTNVLVNTVISTTFSEEMEASTITTNTFTVSKPGSAIAGMVTYSGTTATFTPAYDLDYSITYTATITTGVKDLAGNNMEANYTWTFTTELEPNSGTNPDSRDTTGRSECFIATATYGSSLHPYVKTLREFRDKYLMPNKPGRKFVDLYYRYSPFVADLITKHKPLRILTRVYLLPAICFSYSMVHLGPIITGGMPLFILMLPIFFIYVSRRK